MNKLSSTVLKILFALVVFGGCIYAARVDYEDSIIQGMGFAQYQYIYDRIGGGNQSDVVEEYLNHKEFYDSLSY